MTSSRANDSTLLTNAQTKHRRRLWISRALLLFLFATFLFGAYKLLGRLIVGVLLITIVMVYLQIREKDQTPITGLNEEEPPLLLQNIVASLSQEYDIEEPEIIVTNRGELKEHLFVRKEDGTHYLGVSTVYLDLVSGDALAADIAHEFEHIVNRDLNGGRFRAYAIEFFVDTAILLFSLIVTIAITSLIWRESPIRVHWSLPPFVLLAVSSIGFYLTMQLESRESEWLADIGAMTRFDAEQLARGFIEVQIIYGISLGTRIRDRLYGLLSTHPQTVDRLRFAASVSDASTDEILDSIDIRAIQENAEKYSEITPDLKSDA